jgi:hypothetical protein
MGLDALVDKTVAVWAIALGSFIEMWAAAAYCDIRNDDWSDCKDEWAWAVCAGVISLVLVIVILVLMKFKPDLVEGIFGQVLYVIIFGIWIVTVAICTFEKPFAPGPTGYGYGSGNWGYAGNGYFATWMCCIFSFILIIEGVPFLASILSKVFGSLDDSKRMLLWVWCGSFIEMWHSARICDKSWYCEGMLAWGVSAGAISAGLILIFFILGKFVPAVDAQLKWFALFLALWWVAAVCTLTMPSDACHGASPCLDKDTYKAGLFLEASNGFFGTWAAMVWAVILATKQFGVAMPGSGGGGGGDSGVAKQANPTAESPPSETPPNTGPQV